MRSGYTRIGGKSCCTCKRFFLVLFLFVLLIGAGIAAFYITLLKSPISIEITSTSTSQFTLGDTVQLNATLNSGISRFARYSWSIDYSGNVSAFDCSPGIDLSQNSLSFKVNNEDCFSIVSFTLRASYFGRLFPQLATQNVSSYMLSNRTYYIPSSSVVSFDNVTNVLVITTVNSTNFPSQFMVGDQLLSVDGTFPMVNISEIVSVNPPILTFEVENISVADAFKYMRASSDYVVLSSAHPLKRSVGAGAQNMMKVETPFGDIGIDMGSTGWFKFENGSGASFSCSPGSQSTVINANTLNDFAFDMVCQFSFAFGATANFGPVSTELTKTLLKDDEMGKFDLAWEAFETLKGLLKPTFQLKPIIKLSLDFPGGAYCTVAANYTGSFTVSYAYSSQTGVLEVSKTPVTWYQSDLRSNCNAQTCETHMALAIGLSGTWTFVKVVTLSLEFLFDIPWYDLWPPNYNGTIHTVPPSGFDVPCSTGYSRETWAYGFSWALAVGLQFWGFGIERSGNLDSWGEIVWDSCQQTKCSLPYLRYSCQSWGIFSPTKCVQDPQGPYLGYDTCRLTCEACTTCDNPACCNCPGHTGPCAGSCYFACPGDSGNCCS